MGYLNEDGLARYDGLIKNWVTLKSGTVDGIAPLLNWQKTDIASSVAFYPLPAAPIDPVVNFQFTETGPAEGTKGPDNPSTITGVSSITVTRCETVGVDSTDYTIDLGGTFYGGSVDLSAGTMTVTHGRYVFTGNEQGWSNDGSGGLHSYNATTALGFTQLNLNNYITGTAQDGNSSCTHLPYTATSEANVQSGTRTFACYCLVGGGKQLRFIVPFSTISDLQSWLSAQNAAGTPVAVTYKLVTPFTVQLTPTQIYSLSQLDPYAPRINTVYSDQTSVQVGYPKSPLATSTELTNAIVSLGGNV